VASGEARRHLEGLELPEVLRVSDVAAALRVSKSTVYALCDRGDLPFVRVSGAVRIRSEDLEAYVRRSTATKGWSIDDG
jgi:excisionase family DNA binding protein